VTPETDTARACDRFGCRRAVETCCMICLRPFCALHEPLPYGHVCLSTVPALDRPTLKRVDQAAQVRFLVPHDG
jgi:hypothetical protein